jgi:RNA 2',3'-cyclic 3'-phosphodiesterase
MGPRNTSHRVNPTKSYESALVAIPPKELWGPIQTIRRIHDRHVDRWMPHVTLLYPFRAKEEYDREVKGVEAACAGVRPFRITLAEFRWFRHGTGSATIWLHPQPPEPFEDLQIAVGERFPDCEEVRRHPEGFVPHLSVGQAKGEEEARRLSRDLQAKWEALPFDVAEVALIARDGDGPFRVERVVPLGGGSAG